MTLNEKENLYEFGIHKFGTWHCGTSLDGKEKGYSLMPKNGFGPIYSDERMGEYLLDYQKRLEEDKKPINIIGDKLGKVLRFLRFSE